MSFVVTVYTQPDVKRTLPGKAGGYDSDTGDIFRELDEDHFPDLESFGKLWSASGVVPTNRTVPAS